MNWDWFVALYSLAAIILVLSIVWSVISKILILVIALLFNEKVSAILVLVIGLIPYYLIASFGAFDVLGINDGDISILIAVIIGAFIFINDLVGLFQIKREAEKNYDYTVLDTMKMRYLFIFAELIYYVVAIFNPQLSLNKLTIWIYNTIHWIQTIPVINWLIVIVAFIYALYIIIMGIITILGLIASIFPKQKLSQ